MSGRPFGRFSAKSGGKGKASGKRPAPSGAEGDVAIVGSSKRPAKGGLKQTQLSFGRVAAGSSVAQRDEAVRTGAAPAAEPATASDEPALTSLGPAVPIAEPATPSAGPASPSPPDVGPSPRVSGAHAPAIPARDASKAAQLQRKLVHGSRTDGLIDPDRQLGGPHPASSRPKYTPFEQQVLALRRQNPGVVLVIEVGYKYKLFGEDAELASRVCRIHLGQDNNFLSTWVPAQRVHVHVRRLVEAGHKVGIVRQVETAALKSVSDTRNKVFERHVTSVFTRATLDAGGLEGLAAAAGVEAAAGDAAAEEDGPPVSAGQTGRQSSYLMCIVEDPGRAGPTASLSVVAVEVACGEVLYDTFTDGPVRSDLEARLLLCSPAEVLLPEGLSRETTRIVEHYIARSESAVRLERVPEDKLAGPFAREAVEAFFGEQSPEGHAAGSGAAALQALSLPPPVLRCLALCIDHLRAFRLEGLLRQASVFRPLSEAHEVLLSPNALVQLEILESTEGTKRGSLLWLLDRTRTAAGGRLLRRWVAHPLSSREAIQRRLDAVDFLRDAGDEGAAGPLGGLAATLGSLPDLDRGLTRILHRTASPADFVTTLEAVQSLPERLCRGGPPPTCPPLVARLLADARDPAAARAATDLLALVRRDAARENAKVDLFAEESGAFPRVFEGHQRLRGALQALEDLLPALRQQLRIPGLGYRSVQHQGDFLIEVPKSHTAVPRDWELVGGTKAVNRYLPPEVKEARLQLEISKETLAAEADRAWLQLLEMASEQYLVLRAAVRALAELDALLALADVARGPGFVRPRLRGDDEGVPALEIREGRHPMLDSLLPEVVPNDCCLSAEGPRALVITGANMGGKSCYMKMAALLCHLAHVGSFVPAAAYESHVVDGIFCRMGASDSLAKGTSTFLEECTEAALLLRRSTARSLIVMDELGRGTSTHDGVAIAEATLRHLIAAQLGLVLFVTHYNTIAALASEMPGLVRAVCMAVLQHASDGDQARGSRAITFLYKIVEGVAPRSFGLNVATLAGVPGSCVARAAVKAAELEEAVLSRSLGGGPEVGAAAALVRAVDACESTASPNLGDVRRAVARAAEIVREDGL